MYTKWILIAHYEKGPVHRLISKASKDPKIYFRMLGRKQTQEIIWFFWIKKLCLEISFD